MEICGSVHLRGRVRGHLMTSLLRRSRIIGVAMVCACSASIPAPGPQVGPEPVLDQQDAAIPSLFPGDAEVLSDSAIRRILDYELGLSLNVRVAVMELGSQWSYRWWWSETTARLRTELAVAFSGPLLTTERVDRVQLLPALLIPEKRTVPYLREAAARFQADLLLVYFPTCAEFERSRLFGSDRHRAVCTIEGILLDVRSGLVPFSGFATGEFETQKTDRDYDERETVVRAELEAARLAAVELGERMASYLRGAPTRN